MAKTLKEWIAADVDPYRDKPLQWLSQYHFFRDPSRPVFSDSSLFFSPADGIILYQKVVEPDEQIVDIKGISYSLRDALRDPTYNATSLVIGIFMTFFDVHVNRIPYSGLLSYEQLEPLDSLNRPMLDVEKSLLDDIRVPDTIPEYLHRNERMVNRIDSLYLGQEYYVLQIADYDVDCICPFEIKQHQPAEQGQRFSQIRYGSQVDLILPLSTKYDFVPTQEEGNHVEAGIDHLVKIRAK